MIDPVTIAALVGTCVAAAASVLAARSSSRAQMHNTDVTSRTAAETDAYNRARAFDIETITRQDTEIEALRTDNQHLHSEVRQLTSDKDRLTRQVEQLLADAERKETEMAFLRQRITRLERGIPITSEEPIRERAEDVIPPISD